MNATLARLTRFAVDSYQESDACLLDRFLAGSEAAFRELIYRHGPLVFGVCNRVLRHQQDAEDAFQAVFLVLARRAADVWPRDTVGSWLYGVAYRVAQKARALRSRRMGREQPLQDVAQLEHSRSEPDTAEIIDRVVRKLPEIYRAAVVACDLEGLSRKDAAGQLGWTEGTLSGRLARARKLLANRLRKAGVALPAGGLAMILGTNAAVRAGLEEVALGLGTEAAGVSAPVAALVEGVVQSMFVCKLKTVAVAMLVVCAIGYGAWSAGAGDGPSNGTTGAAVAMLPAGQPVQPATQAAPPKTPPALDPLQGKWRIITISEGKTNSVVWSEKDEPNVIEITGATLSMPYREAGGARKRQEFKIAVDDTKMPRTIDLIAPGKPVGKGIYELAAPAVFCSTCHKTESIDSTPSMSNLMGLCTPAMKHTTTGTSFGLRLAIAVEGQRPTKFGAEGVIEFSLQRISREQDERELLKREEARLAAFLKTMQGNPADEEVERVVAKLKVVRAKMAEKEARRTVEDATYQVRLAEATVQQARAQLEKAAKNLELAKARLAQAEKDTKKSHPPAAEKKNETFTIHLRPLEAGEKTLWVEMAGIKSVLEAVAYAASDMAIKPDAVHVWLVREKEILPVDLTAIYKGDTKTNYTIKPGDQLFVQVKIAK